MKNNIEVRGARTNNLRNIDIDIPKHKITIFTGVSGSGKSSLVFDTIAAESQRLLNETYSMFIQGFLPHYGQPDVDSLKNLSVAIVIDQQALGGNSRSTVGTVSDTYNLLRMFYAQCGSSGPQNPKLFSFNDPQGMCSDCAGTGKVSEIDLDRLIDRSKTLREGAIAFPSFAVDSWFWKIIAQSGFFDLDKKVGGFTSEEWDRLLHLPETKFKVKPQDGGLNVTYEGLLPKIKRLYLEKDLDSLAPHLRAATVRISKLHTCPACNATRLNQAALDSCINGRNIAECLAMSVQELGAFVKSYHGWESLPVLQNLAKRLDDMVQIGLGYLNLYRESSTLSGGESQRIKLVRHVGSSLTDVTYILDEPSVGLHPHDVHRLTDLLRRMRDKGNTVLVVEHNPLVMAIADQIVDLGPGAGREGGQLVFQGAYRDLLRSDSLTGKHLRRVREVKDQTRIPDAWLSIEDATLNNVKNLTFKIPKAVLTVVTGVSGAGKSSLICGCFCSQYPDAVMVDQHLGRGSRRSIIATYTGVLDEIRKSFARANGVDAGLFSANSQGACPECQGLGVTFSELAYLDPVANVCEACEGKRFSESVLKYTLRGLDIGAVYAMSVHDAMSFFSEPRISAKVQALNQVGLGYLSLGQALSSLSGGERQRIKLANELCNPAEVYVLDEPTNGLHLNDVDTLIKLLDQLVDHGSTVIVIEHHQSVICQADWVIDLGPGAGMEGGDIVFQGTPAKLRQVNGSLTAQHLPQNRM